MYPTEKSEEAKQSNPTKTIVFTMLWFVLAASAMLFIAFAGHI